MGFELRLSPFYTEKRRNNAEKTRRNPGVRRDSPKRDTFLTFLVFSSVSHLSDRNSRFKPGFTGVQELTKLLKLLLSARFDGNNCPHLTSP